MRFKSILFFLLIPLHNAFCPSFLPHDLSVDIVKGMSNTLSSIDHVSSIVLSQNAHFINYILNHPYLSDELKKKLVLMCIQMAQNGDEMGGDVLQSYYNCVNNLI